MEYTVFLSEEAKFNLQESADYYLKVSANLNQRFEKELDNCITSLKREPFLYQIRYKNIRIAYLENFPFGIHFIIEKEAILILKILHTKRFYK